MNADEKKLLGIEDGDPRNEDWPKISPELKRLLNLESKGLYYGERVKNEAIAPVVAGAARVIGSAARPALKAAGAMAAQAVADKLQRSSQSTKSQAPQAPQDESTMSASMGQIMSLASPVIGRPNQIASYDASVDVNGFKPARLGMVMANPVQPFTEARRFRDAAGAAEHLASEALRRGRGRGRDTHADIYRDTEDGSIHVQHTGRSGRDGSHPSEDPGNKGRTFERLTRGDQAQFTARPAEVRDRAREVRAGVPDAEGWTMAPDTPRHRAMQTLRRAVRQIVSGARRS
jgi:hypothetical protein